jgi:hypothetical protein
MATVKARQWAPTPEEAKRLLQLLVSPEGYSRRSRIGGILRRVA